MTSSIDKARAVLTAAFPTMFRSTEHIATDPATPFTLREKAKRDLKNRKGAILKEAARETHSAEDRAYLAALAERVDKL